MSTRGRALWLALVVPVLAAGLSIGAPAAFGDARVIKTIGPPDTRSFPVFGAVNLSTNTIYITNLGGEDGLGPGADHVTVINGANDTVVTNIVVADHVSGIDVNQRTGDVFVANTVAGSIAIIDGATNTVRKTVPLPPPPGARYPCGLPSPISCTPAPTGFPGELTIDQQTGLVYVANAGELPSGQTEPDQPVDCCDIPGVVSVYDPAADRWVKGGADGIPAGISPIEPVINSRTHRVYVTSLDSDIVTVIDTRTNEIVDTIQVLPEPYGIAVDERENLIYVGHIDGSRLPPLTAKAVLEVISGGRNRLIRPIYAGSFTRNVAVHPRTGRVYVANLNTSSLSILENDHVVQRVPVGLGPRAIVVNPRTNKIYVGNTAVSQDKIAGAPDGLPDTISVLVDPTPSIRLSVTPRRAVLGRRRCFRFRARSTAGGLLDHVTVRFAGKQRRTGHRGLARICVRLDTAGRQVAEGRRTGYRTGRTAVRT